MPWDPDLHISKKRVLVLTQERLHLIQQAEHPFRIDLVFVDEAQNLGYPDRGVLLKQVLDRAAADNPQAQVVFASPFSRNPEVFVESAPAGLSSAAFVSETVTVNQNLIRVEGVYGRPLERSIQLLHEGVPKAIGSVVLENRAPTANKRLAYVAHALGGTNGGNIVYVNGPSDAEVVAKNIFGINRCR
jgi:hypothetical protein